MNVRTTDGLILRETPVGENDKFVSVLTRRYGLMRVAARGARKSGSRLAAATQPLTHIQLSARMGKSNWYIDDARPLHIFFDLRRDLERLSLAQYFCELAGTVCLQDEPAEEPLRLLLNALHYLSNGARPPLLLKATVELRLLSLAGYAPDLSLCAHCHTPVREGGFLPLHGQVVCPAHSNTAYPLTAAALGAMRQITAGTLEACFAPMPLAETDLGPLAAACEAFAEMQLNRRFSTLAFYKTLTT